MAHQKNSYLLQFLMKIHLKKSVLDLEWSPLFICDIFLNLKLKFHVEVEVAVEVGNKTEGVWKLSKVI